MILPVKISGIEFTPNGNRLLSKWLPNFVDETIQIGQLYDLAEVAIAKDMPFTSVKQDTLFLVSSHKQLPLGIDADNDLNRTLIDVYPQISEDHYIIVWVRQ